MRSHDHVCARAIRYVHRRLTDSSNNMTFTRAVDSGTGRRETGFFVRKSFCTVRVSHFSFFVFSINGFGVEASAP